MESTVFTGFIVQRVLISRPKNGYETHSTYIQSKIYPTREEAETAIKALQGPSSKDDLCFIHEIRWEE
jgi:hypothetical protein